MKWNEYNYNGKWHCLKVLNQKDSQNGYFFVVVNMWKSYNSTIKKKYLEFHINLIFQNFLSTLLSTIQI